MRRSNEASKLAARRRHLQKESRRDPTQDAWAGHCGIAASGTPGQLPGGKLGGTTRNTLLEGRMWTLLLDWVEAHKTFVGTLTSMMITLLTLGGGLLVGQRLTAKWNIRVKEREDDLEAMRRVRALYGELLATRRLWNLHCREGGKPQLDDPRRRDLLDRAAAADGAIEAILMKAAFERKLSPDEQDQLGLLRHGFHQLRRQIRDNMARPWSYSDHPEYKAVKQATHTLIDVIARGERQNVGSTQFEYVTDNLHEERWANLTKNWSPGPSDTPQYKK